MHYFLWALGLLFIGLKLTGHIAWAWWLVLLPIYGPAVVLLAAAAFCFSVAGVIWLTMSKEERASHREKQRVKKALGAYAEALRRKSQ